jgi:hypothetical protein
MNINIDIKFLTELNININEYLTLYKIHCLQNKIDSIPFISEDKWLESLVNKNYISRKDGAVNLTEQGVGLFATQTNKIDVLIEKLKDIYPKGKKNGQYYWFGNKPEIKTKLKTFFKIYKNTSYEQVEKAITNYVNSFTDYNRDSGMMLLKYFITKDDMSTLYTYIENLNDEESNKEVKSFNKDI